MLRLLLVEDDPSVLPLLILMLEDDGHRVVPVTTGEEAVRLSACMRFDVCVIDIRLPGINGYQTKARIHAHQPDLGCIAITGFDYEEAAVLAKEAGFVACLRKPIRCEQLSAALMFLAAGRPQPVVTPSRLGDIIGASDAMQDVFDRTVRIARSDRPVLISGETGTGKELVAHAIHEHSARSDAVFNVVDCGRLVESLMESELFGHERGAFTGADARVLGAFERAQGGTLLLDEVGELPPSAQTRLLGVLERREITRVGGHDRIPVDVRVLAATNVDLEAALGEGFRPDLYERLHVLEIRLPPLRERPDDIRLLIDHFVSRMTKKEEGLPRLEISDEAYRAMERYSWPRNVRQLKHALERAAILCRGGVIDVSHLDLGIQLPGSPELSRLTRPPDFVEGMTLAELISRSKEVWIAQALETTRGNVGQAARLLGVNRRTIERQGRRR